jgi:hypothetical protein
VLIKASTSKAMSGSKQLQVYKLSAWCIDSRSDAVQGTGYRVQIDDDDGCRPNRQVETLIRGSRKSPL